MRSSNGRIARSHESAWMGIRPSSTKAPGAFHGFSMQASAPESADLLFQGAWFA